MTERDVERELHTITQTIVRKFDPERIILFGSRVWGTPSVESDADLFVVKKTGRSTREVARDIDGALWGRHLPLDILVYTPEGVQRSLQNGNLFVRDILENGKVLYERREA